LTMQFAGHLLLSSSRATTTRPKSGRAGIATAGGRVARRTQTTKGKRLSCCSSWRAGGWAAGRGVVCAGGRTGGRGRGGKGCGGGGGGGLSQLAAAGLLAPDVRALQASPILAGFNECGGNAPARVIARHCTQLIKAPAASAMQRRERTPMTSHWPSCTMAMGPGPNASQGVPCCPDASQPLSPLGRRPVASLCWCRCMNERLAQQQLAINLRIQRLAFVSNGVCGNAWLGCLTSDSCCSGLTCIKAPFVLPIGVCTCESESCQYPQR
jgi:hypothetical protein